jgi:hypothetical protein
MGWRQPDFYQHHHKSDVGVGGDEGVAEWASVQCFESTTPRYRVENLNLDAILPVTIMMAPSQYER